MLKLMRFYFKWLSLIAPNLSSQLATKIFYKAKRTKQSLSEVAVEKHAQERFIQTPQGKLKTLLWKNGYENNKVVLLAHGWGGRGTQLYRFIAPLLKHFNVVTFDGPAHGASPGKITTLPKYAQAMASVCKEFEISNIIAHSFGAGAAAVAIASHHIAIERAVFISSPFSIENVVNNFCKYLQIPNTIAEKIHQRMEMPNWHNMSRINFSFEFLGPRIKIPVLIFHSRDDQYINYTDGKLVSEHLLNAEFITLESLGHYRPITNSKVIEMSTEFLCKK